MKKRQYKVTQRERYFKKLNSKSSSDNSDDFLCDACRPYGRCRLFDTDEELILDEKVKTKLSSEAETAKIEMPEYCAV